MATDTRADTSFTLADLCQAIADGNLPYALHDDHYHLKARDVRHIRSTAPSRSSTSLSDESIDPAIDSSSLNVSCPA